MISGKCYLIINQRHGPLGPRTCHMTDDVFFLGGGMLLGVGKCQQLSGKLQITFLPS